jgi:hypothetical protein
LHYSVTLVTSCVEGVGGRQYAVFRSGSRREWMFVSLHRAVAIVIARWLLSRGSASLARATCIPQAAVGVPARVCRVLTSAAPCEGQHRFGAFPMLAQVCRRLL